MKNLNKEKQSSKVHIKMSFRTKTFELYFFFSEFVFVLSEQHSSGCLNIYLHVCINTITFAIAPHNKVSRENLKSIHIL